MPRKRLSRRELVEKDHITTSLEWATTLVVERGKPLAIGVGVIVLIAAVVVGLRVSASNREAAAENALAEVIYRYVTVDPNMTDQDRFQATLTAAAEVRASFPDETAAQIARYYEALSYRELGDFGQATTILRELGDGGGETINNIARFTLAELYKEEGELDLAVTAYQSLEANGGYAKEVVLYELGKLHEELSKPDEARDYYQSLVGEYPDSTFRANADRALRRLARASGDEAS